MVCAKPFEAGLQTLEAELFQATSSKLVYTSMLANAVRKARTQQTARPCEAGHLPLRSTSGSASVLPAGGYTSSAPPASPHADGSAGHAPITFGHTPAGGPHELASAPASMLGGDSSPAGALPAGSAPDPGHRSRGARMPPADIPLHSNVSAVGLQGGVTDDAGPVSGHGTVMHNAILQGAYRKKSAPGAEAAPAAATPSLLRDNSSTASHSKHESARNEFEALVDRACRDQQSCCGPSGTLSAESAPLLNEAQAVGDDLSQQSKQSRPGSCQENRAGSISCWSCEYSMICALNELAGWPVSIKMLQQSPASRRIRDLKKHASQGVAQGAARVILAWKQRLGASA